MAKEPPQTIGDMRQKAIVTDDEIAEAVDAYFAEPSLKAFRFASGHILDIRAAIDGHSSAKAAVAKRNTTDAYRRMMVRTAVILAVPEAK